MEYKYECPRCDYSAVSSRRMSPECPKCSTLLFEEVSEEDSPLFESIGKAAYGVLPVENISRIGKIISIDIGIEQPVYESIQSAFDGMGYDAYLRSRNGRYHVYLVERQKDEKKSIFSSPLMYIGLFVATVLSTIFAGYSLSVPLVEEGLMESPWVGAFSFSFGLMAILGCHEMGHKIQSIRSGISSSWPYFIPMPFLPLGTLGALIKMKSAIPTKNDAILLGASGPLVGVVVAIPVVIIGMKLSYIVPAASFGEEGFYLGNSLLFMILSSFSLHVPEGMSIWMHPLAFAGWVGLFVTMLNLLPAGQLDGGHVIRAIFGEKGHLAISKMTVQILIFLGLLGILSEWGVLEGIQQYTWSGWLIWGLLSHFITKGGHPGPLNELEPISTSSKIIAALALIAFVVCFVPVPIIVG
ncbi:MAG: site-2 protease family protein [Candidatus Methanofastidiosia archaeon]